MFRKANLPVLVALAIGAVAGWAGASGKLDSLLRAQPPAAAATEPAVCPADGCCANPGKAAALAAISAHNERVAAAAQPGGKKPNILVIWGDDIGQSNISAYSHGVMGYKTPNIDRLAREGMMFTDYYAEQSCTAGRAAFIMGQSVFRSGLSKVGLPGAALGMRADLPHEKWTRS
jgi:arylsulfatase